jgi:hypothetical protein
LDGFVHFDAGASSSGWPRRQASEVRMMLRETHSESAVSGSLTSEIGLDPDDFFKLSSQLKRLMDRVAVPRRWSPEDVREVQKALKDALRELDRQGSCAEATDSRGAALRQARSALTMSVTSVPTPAWYLCLLAAWESLTAQPLMRRAN